MNDGCAEAKQAIRQTEASERTEDRETEVSRTKEGLQV